MSKSLKDVISLHVQKPGTAFHHVRFMVTSEHNPSIVVGYHLSQDEENQVFKTPFSLKDIAQRMKSITGHSFELTKSLNRNYIILTRTDHTKRMQSLSTKT